MLSEMIRYRAICRPRKLALVLGKFSIQLDIHRFTCSRLAGFPIDGSGDDSLDFAIEGIHLTLFSRQFLLVFRPVALQLRDNPCRLALFLLKRLDIRCPTASDYLGINDRSLPVFYSLKQNRS